MSRRQTRNDATPAADESRVASAGTKSVAAVLLSFTQEQLDDPMLTLGGSAHNRAEVAASKLARAAFDNFCALLEAGEPGAYEEKSVPAQLGTATTQAEIGRVMTRPHRVDAAGLAELVDAGDSMVSRLLGCATKYWPAGAAARVHPKLAHDAPHLFLGTKRHLAILADAERVRDDQKTMAGGNAPVALA